MCDRSSKCWFLLCLFIYPTHSEVTPGVSCGGSPVCAFGCMDTYPTPLMCTPTTTITTTHQASHWAALSKNITREKRWKNTCLVWWRNTEREMKKQWTKPLAHLLIFTAPCTERQTCSLAFAVQPLTAQTHTHTAVMKVYVHIPVPYVSVMFWFHCL